MGIPIKNVIPNSAYTVSTGENTQLSLRIGEYKEDGTFLKNHIIRENGLTERKTYTWTTTEETYWLLYVVGADANKYNANYTNYNIMVEEGNQATQFEPAHVIPTTQVTQNQKHKLTAQWKKNE